MDSMDAMDGKEPIIMDKGKKISSVLESRDRVAGDLVGHSVCLHVDLDAVTNNIHCIRNLMRNKRAAICAMVKANAYGHGSVELSRHLKRIGVERLGVATVPEGVQLRRARLQGQIHLMGNVQSWEMGPCLEHDLIPTVSNRDAIIGMADALNNRKDIYAHASNHVTTKGSSPVGAVHIKVDTGMSRNGCQPSELPDLIQLCDEVGVPLEGIFTHLADFENEPFTKQQKDTFYRAIDPYRSRNLMFHLANSGGIMTGVGTELDMVRPGISLYGLPPGADIQGFAKLGFRPTSALKGCPTLVKKLESGSAIGYGCSYRCDTDQWVATLPIGYGDGFFRSLSNRGIVIRDKTGERCPVIGRVSMDAITFKTPEQVSNDETFTLITRDFDPDTSATGIANLVGTINYEVMTRLAPRVPRVYSSCNHEPVVQIFS